MGQEELLKLLKEQTPKWFTSKELITISKSSPSSISISIKKLLNYKLIEEELFVTSTGHKHRRVRFK